MAQLTKRVSVLFLLALLTSTTVIFAQDAESFTVVGSGIVNSIVDSLAEANETDTITITTTGTSAGFEEFCAGNADVVTATRAISSDEDATCISNELVYSEFLVGHSILAFAVNPSITFVECLTANDFNTLFAPTAAGQTNSWTVFDETVEDLPVTLILPHDDTVEYVILDSLVGGDGLRRDADRYVEVESALSQVADTEGAITVIPFSNDLTQNESIVLLDVNYNTTTGCASPSVQNVENRLYNASQEMFLYVNRASLEDNESLQDLMDFVTTVESSTVIEDAGFMAPGDETYALNADILENAEAGRQFTGTESEFTIPDTLFGQIDISGAANAYSLLDTIATQLTSNQQQLTINLEAEGQEAGIRRLCNGETDIAVLQSEPTESALAGCEANNINTVLVPIGTQATVLVANAADTYATCLTSGQLSTIWSASATDNIDNWSQVDTAFPDQDMTLFGLSTTNEYSDILLMTGEPPVEPVRRDTELSNDALYRAAAVGNVEGSLTYMSWTDYQRVLDTNQQNIQLVSVDNGSGCVQPSVETITDGSYPLSRPASLLVNELSLTDVSLQSYLWRLFSDEGWTVINREGFVGIGFGDLPAVRTDLETEFSLAEANVAASVDSPEAESTTEPESPEEAEADSSDESMDESPDAESSDSDESPDSEVTEEADDADSELDSD